MRAVTCAVLAALLTGCALWGDPVEPFCDVARCAEECVDGVGCVEHRASDGVAHLLPADGERSLCGAVVRDETAPASGGEVPCEACDGGGRGH